MSTRNPNLDFSENSQRLSPTAPSPGERADWYTGAGPTACPGFRSDGTLGSLIPPSLENCSRTQVQAYFDNTWTLTELLFSGLVSEEVFVRSPYHGLRHPLIFYYGHPAVLYVNKLRVAGLLDGPVNEYFERIFETGVDEMSWDDMSKNAMVWPSVDEVHAYRRSVYAILSRLIATHPDLADGHAPLSSHHPLWALFLGFEHERIHLETSSVLMRELPLSCVRIPAEWPKLRLHRTRPRGGRPDGSRLREEWISLAPGSVVIGKPGSHPSFGWDNEYGQRRVDVPETQVSRCLVSNGEFFDFVEAGGYAQQRYWSREGWDWRSFRNVKWPTFWMAAGPQGSHLYRLRTIFESVEMPWDWPVVVNSYEAQAYCSWKSEKEGKPLRLITEAEHHRLRTLVPAGSVFNLGLASGSETSVDASHDSSTSPQDVFGNVWQWCVDDFHPLPGFEVHPYYDDFSTPCFDGRHTLIMGGSFVSTGDEASPFARFHFRPHFFQHAGFRMAQGEPSTAVRLRDPGGEAQVVGMHLVSRAAQYLRELASMPPMGVDFDPFSGRSQGELALPLGRSATMPETGIDARDLLDGVFGDFSKSFQKPGHPRYFAYLAGGADPLAAWAQSAALMLNPFSAHHALAASCVEMEREIFAWLANLFGFPATAHGLLTTGSSLALLSAVHAARMARGSVEGQLRIYLSDRGHHAVRKAALFAGLGSEAVALVPCRDGRMDVAALEIQMAVDRERGLSPLMVVGTAGDTHTGCVDPLEEIIVACRRAGVWFHVDAAYGGAFQLTRRGAQLLRGIESADSLNIDFHKSFSMPYGTGCLLVREGRRLRDSVAFSGEYMPPALEDADFPDPADAGPELSRDFRALRVWFPLRVRGAGYYRNLLEERLGFADRLEERLAQHPRIQVLGRDLSVVAFHLGDKTAEALRRINARGRVFLSGTRVGDQDVIRVAILSAQCTEADVDLCAREIEEVAGL